MNTDLSNEELLQLFKLRFVDAKTAADICGYEKVSSINTLVHRGHLIRYRVASRFAVYDREAVSEWAANRPGKGGRPPKNSD